MSPASTPASPAVLNSFLQSQVPQQLVGRGKEVVSRNVLAGKIVGGTHVIGNQVYFIEPPIKLLHFVYSVGWAIPNPILLTVGGFICLFDKIY